MTEPFRARLKALGLTAKAFATLTGNHPTTISRWAAEPRWAWLLVEAWGRSPRVLADVKRKLPGAVPPEQRADDAARCRFNHSLRPPTKRAHNL